MTITSHSNKSARQRHSPSRLLCKRSRLLCKRSRLLCGLAVTLCLFSAGNLNASTRRPTPDPELRNVLLKAVNSADSFKDRYAAEVWLMDMSSRLKKQVPNPKERVELLKNVHFEAKRAKLPPEMVLAVIEVESNFNRWAISRVGAQGLMQVMPFWLKEIGHNGDSLFSIKTNLRFGCTILSYYLRKEKGDWMRALARYNGSIGRNKYPNKIFKKLTRKWFRR